MRVRARFVLLPGAVFVSILSAAALHAAAGAAQQRPTEPAAVAAAGRPTLDAAGERQLFERYCYACHSERAKAAGLDSAKKLTLDTLDTSNVHRDAKTWELVTRKLRAGMMPPVEMRRPDPATYESMIAWLESELDRGALPYTPPPGLHRLNRTEYA